jgi:hypothetical protein
MAADLTMGEQRERALQRSIGVMQDNELDAVVLVGRGVAAVDAQARRATRNSNQQAGEQCFFNGGKHVGGLSV